MTHRQARTFFLLCTFGFAAIFIAMTLHSHTRFGELTNAQNITPEVVAGKNIWHRKNCVNCHTLFGEGAYYAPDLTKITDHRGAEYLKAFMRDPARFYSEEKHRRVMPNPDLSEREIEQMLAFLTWISKVDNQGWPPRPILVAGGSFPGTSVTARSGEPPAGSAPEAEGEALFRATPPGCFACHSIAPGVNLAGPSLAGIATRAARLVAEEEIEGEEYEGEAKDARGYLRESILSPSAHLVPGAIYSSDNVSMMPADVGRQLSEQQLDQLIAYMMTLK